MGRIPVDHLEELHTLTSTGNPTIALVAGEASGDQLGAALIERLRVKYPRARFAGIGGKQMKAAGLEAWWDAEELALFGLFEVVSHLPRLLRLRRDLHRRLVDLSPDIFVGIDAPDFNLGLEIKLRKAGIRTIQYVSPTVWAWRQYRVRKIARAAGRVLCLFPFEPDFFKTYGVPASYVGHPMADQIDSVPSPLPAREQLGLNQESTTVAILPGSRASEVSRLAEPMLEAARSLAAERPDIQFIAAMANERARGLFEQAMKQTGFDAITLAENDPRAVIAAADVVLCASGTVTLETLLINRPMVVAYRISTATYWAAKSLRLIQARHFALPNILAGKLLVPELIQQAATSERLASETRRWLDDSDARDNLRRSFSELHDHLRCDAASKAAEAVAEAVDQCPG